MASIKTYVIDTKHIRRYGEEQNSVFMQSGALLNVSFVLGLLKYTDFT